MALNNLQAPIGENESVTGEVGVERFWTVEGCQHTTFPDQQIWIATGECVPRLRAAGAGYALAYQKQVGPSDGLVIAPRFPLCGGEALQGIGESFQRLENRVPTQILKPEPDVVCVTELVSGSRATFEPLDQLLAGHFFFPEAAFFPAGSRLISLRRWLALESRSRA